ncbi:hypothetical protein NM208_g5050 [Fusarium decemcellulare]|uniref:Uncharacterized protein n=1 Tax=Fusarium decemcellulare TaxID=57161 RepID=A0ACC1SIQ7_9HYPO|nr:hypothetical protein NM208_g5050 [Fusarium decemcellulare]
MLEIAIGVLGLLHPLVTFTSRIGSSIDSLRKTKKFMKNERNLHRLRREIDAWGLMIDDVSDSPITASASESQAGVMFKKNVLKHRLSLKEIKREFEEYLGVHKPIPVVMKVRKLMREVKDNNIEEEIRKWMEALNCSRTSNINKKVEEIREMGLAQNTTNSEVKNMLCNLVCYLTGEDSTLMFPQRMTVINRTVQDLEESLRQCSTLAQTSDADSDSGFDSTTENEAPDTADTTLQDEALDEALDTAPAPLAVQNCLPDYADRSSSPINFEAERPTTIETPYPVTHRSNILYHGLYKLSPSYEVNDETLINFGAGNHFTFAGCFERSVKRDQSDSSILTIDQNDWDSLYRLGIGIFSRNGMVSLDIDVPARRLDYLDGFGLIIGPESRVRRFSAVMQPTSHMLNKIRDSRSTLFRSAARQITQLFHWGLEDITSRDQVYDQLARLQALQLEIESTTGIAITPGVPQLGSATVCITMEWSRYRAWTKENEPDSALDALYEQGIVATLPLFTRQEPEAFSPHIWCETETMIGDITASNAHKKGVHAIIQEYTYPGLLHDKKKACDSIATRFFVVIFRTGDRDGWVDFVQSVESSGLDSKVPVHHIVSSNV